MQVCVKTKVARKQAELPRFVVIPATSIAAWKLERTTTIDVAINGTAVDPRTIKPWGPDRWFISITQRDCELLGIETGSRIELTLSRRNNELPRELAELLRSDRRAMKAWAGFTKAQQRMLRDHVASAKLGETRARRARRGLVV